MGILTVVQGSKQCSIMLARAVDAADGVVALVVNGSMRMFSSH